MARDEMVIAQAQMLANHKNRMERGGGGGQKGRC